MLAPTPRSKKPPFARRDPQHITRWVAECHAAAGPRRGWFAPELPPRPDDSRRRPAKASAPAAAAQTGLEAPRVTTFAPGRASPHALSLLAVVAEQRRQGQPLIATLVSAGFDEATLDQELFAPLGLFRLHSLVRLVQLNISGCTPAAMMRASQQEPRRLHALISALCALGRLGFDDAQRCILLEHNDVACKAAALGARLAAVAGERWRAGTLEILSLAAHHEFAHRVPDYLEAIAGGIGTFEEFVRALQQPASVPS